VTHVAEVFGTCPGFRLPAGGAQADHVEAVAVRLEPLAAASWLIALAAWCWKLGGVTPVTLPEFTQSRW
jgi:hypothetical protein